MLRLLKTKLWWNRGFIEQNLFVSTFGNFWFQKLWYLWNASNLIEYFDCGGRKIFVKILVPGLTWCLFASALCLSFYSMIIFNEWFFNLVRRSSREEVKRDKLFVNIRVIVDNFYGNQEKKNILEFKFVSLKSERSLEILASLFVSICILGYTDPDTISYFSIVFSYKIKIQEKLLSSTFFV